MTVAEMYCHEISFATPEYDEAVRLRYEVLRKPLHLDFQAEDLATEFDSIHVGCYAAVSSELLGVLILKPLGDGTVKMRQVAVHPGMQSRGVGTFLVRFCEALARNRGFFRIELHARQAAVAFYRQLGYQEDGPMFEEVGIPHLFMWKELPPVQN